MNGHEYRNAIARHLSHRFGGRGVQVYTEIPVGKSTLGKNRRVDVLVVGQGSALAIECKWQNSTGSTDEKIPHALEDVRAAPMPGAIAYAGDGFSSGILHMLRCSQAAAYCHPPESTKDLDHLIAIHFGWWDILIDGRAPM